jgi:putative transposase
MKRKKYSSRLKAKVALTAIKGQKTTNEIGSEFGVHPSQVNRWKKYALDAMEDIFTSRQQNDIKRLQQERDHLYLQIGKLQVENGWLKKTSGILT